MANLQANPWSFTSTDQATSVAITSVTRNGLRSATVVTGSAHGYSANAAVSLQGITGAGLTQWNGGYRIEAVPSATSFIVRIEDQRAALGNVGAVGNVLSVAYLGNLARIEQMLWDGPTAAQTLLVTDVAGNLLWNPTAVTGGTYTYGKLFWVNGLVINTLGSGTLQVTIN